MPNIIDSLIVELGLADGVTKKTPGVQKALNSVEKQGDKTKASLNQVSKTTKETGREFEGLTKVAGTFLALIGGTMAIKSFISDFIDANAALNRLSQNLGIGVSTISAWGNASEQLGGSAAGLQGTFDMLSKAQTQLKLTGESSLIPYFSALGISMADASGKAKPVDEILLSLADRFSGMDRTTANNMGRMMGIDQGTMNLLLRGRNELELTIKRQKESTAVTKAQAEAASKLQTQIVESRQKFEALGRSLLMSAMPAIEKVLDVFSRFGDWVSTNREFVGDFLKVMGVGLLAIGAATLPIDLTVAAVIALGAGIALLWQDYQTWKRGGDSLIDWGKWEPEITAATKGINLLKEAIEGMGHAYEKYYQKLTGHSVKGIGQDIRAIFGTEKVDNPAAIAARAQNAAQRAGGGGSISATARAQADRVAKLTGGNADLIYAQWEHETNGFTNRGATSLNNFAGVNVPGGKGQDYRKFNSADEFGNYFAYLMRPGGRYSHLAQDQNPTDYANDLKKGGYMGDSADNYAKGMSHWLKGIPGAVDSVGNSSGAAAGASSVDHSRTVQVGEVKVYTQATDAPGVAAGLGDAMNFLFTSQANAGLQ